MRIVKRRGKAAHGPKNEHPQNCWPHPSPRRDFPALTDQLMHHVWLGRVVRLAGVAHVLQGKSMRWTEQS